MKKLLSLVLAVIMVLGLVACGNDAPETTAPAETNPSEPAVAGTYTYNYAMAEFPTNWNTHTYQTATDAEILDYISSGFYVFDYNETKDGYAMVDGMAVGDPVDVTADYVGQYGIVEGDTAKAYVVNLRQDLKWEDGTPITANDFVESAKRLLAPEAQNYRADSMYAGSVQIHNAEAYLKQGTYAYSNMISPDYLDEEYVLIENMTAKEDGSFTVEGKGDVWFNINNGGNWGSNSFSDYAGAGYFEGDAMTAWEGVVALANEEGYVAVNAEVANVLCDLVAVLHGKANAAEYEAEAGDYAYREWEELCFYGADMPELAWENVGWFAKSDYELVFVMDTPLSGFYLKYNLPAPLVNVALYDSCASVVDGVYTNTYCTSVETTMSYGPYKLTSYQADKQYVLEKNEYYYDLSEDTYQATSIVVDCVKEPSTRLELFLQGKLDTFGLSADYMDEYQMSDYCYYATGDSTFAMVFNPDADALVTAQAAAGENINKTILTIKEFRQAMSYALDRNAFCLATSPMNAPGFGLFSGLIVSDPEAGTAYRTTDIAKNVLANFWGVSEEYGEGKLYADIDEAVDSITGYNLAKAQELFNVAYDTAIAQGLMDEDDVVEIKIGTPNNTSTFYNNGYEFLVNNYTEAVKGTKLEGKLTFSRDDTLGNAFSDALKNNQVDMLFGVGWTGSALDPYGLIEAYVYTDYQYDDSTDFTAITCDIEINGVVYTASVQDWQKIMNGTACTVTAADGSTMSYSCGVADGDPETRLAILGALEGAVLQNYNFLPIMDDASAQLRGQQIEYYTEDYIFGMGFGGIKYYTFNYTDAEWDAYVAENNGELDYT